MNFFSCRVQFVFFGMIMLSLPTFATPWSLWLQDFIGVSPGDIEQFLRQEAQRRWNPLSHQTQPRTSLQRQASDRALRASLIEPRARSRADSLTTIQRDASPMLPRRQSNSGSPRSRESSPRSEGSSPRSFFASLFTNLPFSGFFGGSPRRLEAVQLPAVPAPVLNWNIWQNIFRFLLPNQLLPLERVSRGFRDLARDMRLGRRALPENQPIAPVVRSEVHTRIRVVREYLDQLMIQAAPQQLRIDLHALNAIQRFDPLRLDELVLEAVREGASRRLLRHDPFLTFADLNIRQRGGNALVLDTIHDAIRRLGSQENVEDLYADVYELAQRGFEDAREVVVRALRLGGLGHERRPLGNRMAEIEMLARDGWHPAQESWVRYLEQQNRDSGGSHMEQIFAAAEAGYPAAQTWLAERAFRGQLNGFDTPERRYEQLLNWAQRGWLRAQQYIVQALEEGLLVNEGRNEEERLADLELYANQGWHPAQEAILIRSFPVTGVNPERNALLYRLAFGRMVPDYLQLVTAERLRGNPGDADANLSAALFALACRGWRGAQSLVIHQAETSHPFLPYPNPGQLLRWYFDIANQLRGLLD